MDVRSKAKAALSGTKTKSGLHVHEISIRKAHKGGHIVTHHMRDESGNIPQNPADAMQEHAVAPGGLLANIAQSGIDDSTQQGQPQPQQADPSQTMLGVQ